MKKLYNGGKGAKRVHPSPPLPPPPSSSSSSITYLSALPTALMALASTLSPQEQQVLAYLLDYSQKHSKEDEKAQRIKRQKNHPPELGCSCFGCYKSFWALWDASPNRHVIHLIIDAFEETLESKETLKGAANKVKGRKKKKKKAAGVKKTLDDEAVVVEEMKADVEKRDDGHHDGDDGYDDGDDDEIEEEEEEEEEEGKSSVRRFMSWVFGN